MILLDSIDIRYICLAERIATCSASARVLVVWFYGGDREIGQDSSSTIILHIFLARMISLRKREQKN